MNFTKQLINTEKPSKSGKWYSVDALENAINNSRVQAMFLYSTRKGICIEKYDKDKLEVKNEYDIDGMRVCAILKKLYFQDKKLFGDFETVISKTGQELEDFIKKNGVEKVHFVLKATNMSITNNIVQEFDLINFQWKEETND